ncbi:hypothetical protein BGZ47_011004 [Haplosporangium gracile]|nr:hypothetical protein BGZ47_011004 [Haplosporangium gracile]
MKVNILGPVLLLTLATQFVRATESTEGDNNGNNNNANLAVAPASVPAASVTKQVVALNRQEAGEALEFAVNKVVEATAKAFEQDDDENEDDDEDQDEEGDEDEDQEQDEALLLKGKDFHYADPLAVTYDTQTAKCKQLQSQLQQPQEQQQEQEQQIITIQKPSAEIGEACIDSFVNFALRFQERCSIKCLKAFSDIFSSPDTLGILNCFGCSNFFVSGFYALGVNCAGILAAYPKAANTTAPRTTTLAAMGKSDATTTTVDSTKSDAAGVSPSKAIKAPKSVDDDSEVVPAGRNNRLGQVKPKDSALPPLDFAMTLKSLGQLSLGDIQDWLNIGSDLVKNVGVGSGSNNGKSEGEEGSDSNKKEKEANAAVSKDLFNQFVSKGASFANWTLTPEMLDQTGVFDRVQQSLGL